MRKFASKEKHRLLLPLLAIDHGLDTQLQLLQHHHLRLQALKLGDSDEIRKDDLLEHSPGIFPESIETNEHLVHDGSDLQPAGYSQSLKDRSKEILLNKEISIPIG